MTPKKENSQLTPLSQTEFQELVHEKMRQAVRFTLVTVLEAEIEAFIGAAPYQRTSQRRAYRNGSYQRSLTTSVGQIDDLEVPRTREGFQTQLFERYQRRQAELDASICQMFVSGVSTSRVGEVIETLTGTKPSPSTVSRVFHSLEEEFAAWRRFICMPLPMAAILRLFTTTKATKCRFWQ
jgi:transposase-like protein